MGHRPWADGVLLWAGAWPHSGNHIGLYGMMRVRLKADGRIVEILPDGSEQALSTRLEAILAQAAPRDRAIDSQAAPAPSEARDAAHQADASGICSPHRSAGRNRAQLGAGQALAARARARAAQGDREGAGCGFRGAPQGRCSTGRRRGAECAGQVADQQLDLAQGRPLSHGSDGSPEQPAEDRHRREGAEIGHELQFGWPVGIAHQRVQQAAGDAVLRQPA